MTIHSEMNKISTRQPLYPHHIGPLTATNLTNKIPPHSITHSHTTQPENSTELMIMLSRGIISTPHPTSSLRLRPATPISPRNVAVSLSRPLLGDYPLSISDEALESRGFALRRTAEGLDLDELNTVFVAVGFPRRDTERIRVALEHTESMVWVEQRKTRRAVAFARATGDGVFNAIIWDVVVDPSFQGIGLGKAVVERIIQDLVGKGINNIALYSEPRVLGFYRPLGFVADPDGIKGMVYSRKNNKQKKITGSF